MFAARERRRGLAIGGLVVGLAAALALGAVVVGVEPGPAADGGSGAAGNADSGPAVGVESSPSLVVTDEGGEEVLLASVENGDSVVLEYTHSVERTTVRDVYVVREGGLALTRTEFKSYGAGLPSNADVEITDDGTFVRDLPADDPGPVIVATGAIADHDLVVDGDRYDLADRADGGTVTIAIERGRTQGAELT